MGGRIRICRLHIAAHECVPSPDLAQVSGGGAWWLCLHACVKHKASALEHPCSSAHSNMQVAYRHLRACDIEHCLTVRKWKLFH
jgi:hypothetical protein